jgi:hypothetical protein
MPNNRKLFLTFFIVLLSFFLQCRTEKRDDKDQQETDETVATHLWSRLSKDHSSSRHKRWIDDENDEHFENFENVGNVENIENVDNAENVENFENIINIKNDESNWTNPRKGRTLLSTSTTENDEIRHDDPSKFPPVFEKVKIQN